MTAMAVLGHAEGCPGVRALRQLQVGTQVGLGQKSLSLWILAWTKS